MEDPTIVLASLSDDKLKESINSLVKHVNDKMEEMVESTNSAVKRMEDKLKSLGSLKIDSGGTNDGGTGRRTQQHEKLTKAVNDASEAVTKETQKLQDLQQSLSGASDREQNFISQKERAANTIAQENELLSKQQSELAALKTQQQSLANSESLVADAESKRKAAVATLDAKMKELTETQNRLLQKGSGITPNEKKLIGIDQATIQLIARIRDELSKLDSTINGVKYSKGEFSNRFAGLDTIKRELETNIRNFESYRSRSGINQEDAQKIDVLLQKYKEYLAVVDELHARQGRLEKNHPVFNYTDAYNKYYTSLIPVIKADRDLTEAEDNVYLAINKSSKASQQKAQIDAQIAAKDKEISETRGRIAAATKEQTAAENNASQAAKEKANIQSQVANQEKQVAEAKKQLTTATQQQTEVEKQSVQNVAQQTAARDKQIKKNQEDAMSFDQIAAALDKARRTVSDFNTKRASGILPSSEDYKRYEQALARIVEYNDKLKQSALSRADANQWANVFDAKRVISDISAVDDRYKKLVADLKTQQAESAKAFNQQMRNAFKMPTTNVDEVWKKIFKLRELLDKGTKSEFISSTQIKNVENLISKLHDMRREMESKAVPQSVANYIKSVGTIEDQLKLAFARANKIPTDQLDLAQAKLERLQALLRDMRERGILSNTQIASTEAEIRKLEQIIGQVDTAQQQTTQSAQRYTEEIRKQAQAIRETKQWQEKGFVTVDGSVLSNQENIAKKKRISLEEQILNLQRQGMYLSQDQTTKEWQLVDASGRRVAIVQQENENLAKQRERVAEIANDARRLFADGSFDKISFTPSPLSGVRYIYQENDERSKGLTIEQQIEKILKEQSAEYERQASTKKASNNGSQRTLNDLQSQARAIEELLEKGKRVKALGGFEFVPSDMSGQTVMQQIISYQEQRKAGLLAENQALNLQLELSNAIAQAQGRIAQEQEKRKKYIQPTATDDYQQILRNAIANKLGIDASKVINADAQYDSIKRVSTALKQLQDAYVGMSNKERNSPVGKQMLRQMQELQRQSQQLRAQMTRPISLKDALSGSEKTLDDIAYKIRQIQSYRSNLSFADPKQKAEIDLTANALERLKKKQDEIIGKNSELFKSNTALGRSWNYMKNRLAFYFTVGASTAFVKNLIEIRGQYEILERSIGILFDSMQKGSEIFRELNDMAIKSPFTTMELGGAAKQLAAYDIAAKDVVDTTRRLADIAAAVGVPIDRLTYALGQIKSYGYLNSRDARMFANAGIPLVKNLADMYTKLEGRMVSMGDVYKRIHDKEISFEDTLKVLNAMTDEGGKFFDFQAKSADTLKIKLANLNLAYNTMLNDIGKDSQGIISASLSGIKMLMDNWQTLSGVLTAAITSFGLMKTYNFLLSKAIDKSTVSFVKETSAVNGATAAEYRNVITKNSLTKSQAKFLIATNKSNMALRAQIVNVGILTEKEASAAAKTNVLGAKMRGASLAVVGFANAVKSVAASLVALAPQMLVFLGISAVVDGIMQWEKNAEAAEEFGETFRKNAEENAKSIKEFLGTLVFDDAKTLNSEDAEKAWQGIREEIEKSTAAAEEYVAVLMKEPDIAKRINKGREVLKKSEQIHEIMALWNDETVDVAKGFTVLGLGTDGLNENLKDFVQSLNRANDEIKQMVGNEDQMNSGFLKFADRAIDAWDYIYWAAGTLPAAVSTMFGDEKGLVSNLFGSDFVQKAELSNTFQNIGEDIERFTGSIKKQLDKESITDPFMIREALEKSLKDAAVMGNWTQQELLTARILAERKFREYYSNSLNQGNEDWNNALGGRNAAWDAWMQYLIAHHKEAFREVATTEMDSQKWVNSNASKLYKETFETFKKENALAAQEIKDTVYDLNQLEVRIKVYYDQPKPETDAEVDFRNRGNRYITDKWFNDIAKGATTQTEIVDKLKKKQKDLAEQQVRAEKAGGYFAEKNLKTIKENNEEVTKLIHAYGALTDEEEKRKNKKGKDVLAEMLSKEAQLVKQLQSDYDKLTKAGMTSAGALSVVRKTYSATIREVNKNLGSFGLKGLDLNILQGKDPSKVLKYFTELRDTIQKKGLANLKRLEPVEAVIKEFTVSVQTYNMEKVTKGLNNELDKIKEEYELAVEIDANPELGSIFAGMLGIPQEELDNIPRTANQAMELMQKAIDKSFSELEEKNKKTADSIKEVQDAETKLLERFGKSDVIKAIEESFGKGNVNVIARPIVEATELVKKGWNDAVQDIAETPEKKTITVDIEQVGELPEMEDKVLTVTAVYNGKDVAEGLNTIPHDKTVVVNGKIGDFEDIKQPKDVEIEVTTKVDATEYQNLVSELGESAVKVVNVDVEGDAVPEIKDETANYLVNIKTGGENIDKIKEILGDKTTNMSVITTGDNIPTIKESETVTITYKADASEVQDVKNDLPDNTTITYDVVVNGVEDAKQQAKNIATVFSSSYGIIDKEGKIHEVLITPILPDGTVLSQDEMEKYIAESLDGADDILKADTKNIVIGVDVEGDAGEKLHKLHEELYNLPMENLAEIENLYGKVPKFDLSKMLNKSDFDKWVEENGHLIDDNLVKALENFRTSANKMQVNEGKDLEKNYEELLKKYDEYQNKLNSILIKASNERLTLIKKYGKQEQIDKGVKLVSKIAVEKDPEEKARLIAELKEIVDDVSKDNNLAIRIGMAIDTQTARDTAKLAFEEFQKGGTWITATGNLSGLTNKALGTLITRLKEYKKEAKNLDPKEIKKINNALKSLYRQQREGNPFNVIGNAVDEAKDRFDNYEESIRKIEEEIKKFADDNGTGEYTEEQQKKLDSLIETWKKLREEQEESGKVSAKDIVSGIQSAINAVGQLVGTFNDLFDALNGNEWSEAKETVNDTFSVLQGAASYAAMGALIGGGVGAAIGAVFGGVTSAITAFTDNSNKKIDNAIKRSERAVKRLELAYIDLQKAVDKAYGTSVIGAKTAAAAAKKLELQELERQLRLERSRDSKHRDEDRIIELQKQIKELKYEIHDTYTEIVNDLMGTDVGSFAENLVSAMVDAFKQGEDAMKVFNDKFDELIDNMIMKSLMSRIVSSYIDKLWEDQETKIKARSKKESDDLAKAQAEYDKVKNMDEDEWLMYHYGTNKFLTVAAKAADESGLKGEDLAYYLKNLYDKRMEALEASVDEANKALSDATAWTSQDIKDVMSEINSMKGGLYDDLMEGISQWYTFGQDSDKTLSALQQGIQGITEDTAGALEAYMNGVSQQVYLHSDLLTQIRDAVVGIDMDVQVATQAQMLLQLQQSYAVQMAIQGILEGWTNPSGQAVRVELVS